MNKENPDFNGVELETKVNFGKAYFNLKIDVIEKLLKFFTASPQNEKIVQNQ